MSEFKNKVVIVTGAGGGLGRQHALEFASRGAKVLVNDLGGSADGTGSGDAADLVVKEILEAGGVAIANKSSVATIEGAQAIVDDAMKEFGTVDILVNNAGILRDKSFKKMRVEDWDIVLDVHLNGSAYVSHCVWPIMVENNYGRIVMTSSPAGLYGNFGQANYSAAKMGMIGLMNTLSLEGASKNICVNGLAPLAMTRLLGDVPGFENMGEDERLHPRLITPAVLYLCHEKAPSGVIVEAFGGRFSVTTMYANDGVDLGLKANFEGLLANSEQLLDMSTASEGKARVPQRLLDLQS